MNERELDQVLRTIHLEGMAYPDSDAVIRHALSAPIDQTPQRRFVLPTLPSRGFQSMFSATRLAVAGAIVALFGGFLLSGVLTQPPEDSVPPAASASSSPEPDASEQTVRSDLLPGVDLIAQEVEPGVYRVLDDLAGHDLVARPPRELIFAPDGDIVLFFRSEGAEPGVGLDGFYTLGEAGVQSLDGLRVEPTLAESPGSQQGIGREASWFDATFDRGRNLVVSGVRQLATFDGDTWTELTWPNGDAAASAVETGPDGAIWVMRCKWWPSPRVARIDDGGLGKYQDQQLGVADASLVVLAQRYGTRSLLTLDHRHFEAVRPMQGGRFRLLP